MYFLITKDPEIIPGNILSYRKGSWNHTRQYTFLSQRILKSYQAIYFLMVKDFEIIPGNVLSYDTGFWNHTRQYTFLSQRILKSYQAIYFVMTKDPEIIPGSILSDDRGSWNHTRQYTLLRQANKPNPPSYSPFGKANKPYSPFPSPFLFAFSQCRDSMFLYLAGSLLAGNSTKNKLVEEVVISKGNGGRQDWEDMPINLTWRSFLG